MVQDRDAQVVGGGERSLLKRDLYPFQPEFFVLAFRFNHAARG